MGVNTFASLYIGFNVDTTLTKLAATAWASTPLEHWGVAGRAPKKRESRRRRQRGGEVWGGAVPLPSKFMNFSSQNGVIWCILGVLFLNIRVSHGL